MFWNSKGHTNVTLVSQNRISTRLQKLIGRMLTGRNIPFLLVASVIVEKTEIRVELLRMEDNERHSHHNTQEPLESDPK